MPVSAYMSLLIKLICLSAGSLRCCADRCWPVCSAAAAPVGITNTAADERQRTFDNTATYTCRCHGDRRS